MGQASAPSPRRPALRWWWGVVVVLAAGAAAAWLVPWSVGSEPLAAGAWSVRSAHDHLCYQHGTSLAAVEHMAEPGDRDEVVVVDGAGHAVRLSFPPPSAGPQDDAELELERVFVEPSGLTHLVVRRGGSDAHPYGDDELLLARMIGGRWKGSTVRTRGKAHRLRALLALGDDTLRVKRAGGIDGADTFTELDVVRPDGSQASYVLLCRSCAPIQIRRLDERRFQFLGYAVECRVDCHVVPFCTLLVGQFEIDGTWLWSKRLPGVPRLYAELATISADGSFLIPVSAIGADVGCGPVRGFELARFSASGRCRWARRLWDAGVPEWSPRTVHLDDQGNTWLIAEGQRSEVVGGRAAFDRAPHIELRKYGPEGQQLASRKLTRSAGDSRSAPPTTITSWHSWQVLWARDHQAVIAGHSTGPLSFEEQSPGEQPWFIAKFQL